VNSKSVFWGMATASILMCASPVFAATINASSCSLDEVQRVYSSASDGDRVNIPAGNCSWSGALNVAKGVSIEGAGIGRTVINGARFNVTVPDGRAWAVGNLTFAGTAGFNVTGFSKQGRIHHSDFTGVTGFTQNRVLWLSAAAGGYNAGVIDHNVFAKPRSIQIHIREQSGNGNYSWARPLGLGGTDAWYIEDNDFSQDTGAYNVSTPVTDCDGGGRMVFRYNRVTNNYTEMHDAIISGLRSCRKWEIYGNQWLSSQSLLNSTGQYAQIAIRGGTGVVFDNSFAATTSYDLIFSNYRSGGQTAGTPWTSSCQSSSSARACLNTTSTSPQACTSDSQCGGVSGSCAKIDGVGGSGMPTNYPCRDQMGQGGNATQETVPALFWNNKRGSTLVNPMQRPYADANYLVSGRDYCAGATKPASCGGKAVTYQPYTYPHPLAGGSTTPPPPTGGTCTSPRTMTEFRVASCPSGTVGSFVQTRGYFPAAYPTCWAAAAWSPATAPAGVCVLDGNPAPVINIGRSLWELTRGTTRLASYSSEQACIDAATGLQVTQLYVCTLRTSVDVRMP
jgi:hypothetical protein